MAAALMEAELDRSPTPATGDDSSDDDALVDEHLLAEERKLYIKRLDKEKSLAEQKRPVVRDDLGAKLLTLVDTTLLYTDGLAGQFASVVEATLAEPAAPVQPEGESKAQPPKKKARTGNGKRATPQPPAPTVITATKRLLPLITAELRDYQIKGVAWLISLYKNGVSGILADEMGLGKTLQTIGFISYIWSNTRDNIGKYMVVAPLSTLSNWVAEFKRFCPSIPVLLYHGTKAERADLRSEHLSGSERSPVIVTSYEIIIADRTYLERLQYKILVVDEGHRLKNFNCRLIRDLRALDVATRLLLTGTPLQNNLRELWSLLSFCMPTVFPDADMFLDWFDIQTPATAIPTAITAAPAPDADGAVAAPAPGKKGRGGARKSKTATTKAASSGGNQESQVVTMISRLHAVLKPFVLRRVKADVNIGVPPKQEVILYADMTEEQQRLTRGLIAGTLQGDLAKEAGHGMRIGSLNNLIMQMRKVCNHPDLITGRASGVTTYPPAEELLAQCGKLRLLDRLLDRLLAKGHKVLIFSQMTEMLNILEAYLHDRGLRALRIDGSIPLQERQESIAVFQRAESDQRIFLLSTRAGGLGINLTAADTVIIYDSDWNPHQDSQAMDRCHRIGQSKPVLVFRLVTANSVENRMLAKAESKKALGRVVIKNGAFKELTQAASSTSAEELMQLLNPDRSSDNLAQSGVVSDDVLDQLLDRTHLARAFEAAQTAAAIVGPGGQAGGTAPAAVGSGEPVATETSGQAGGTAACKASKPARKGGRQSSRLVSRAADAEPDSGPSGPALVQAGNPAVPVPAGGSSGGSAVHGGAPLPAYPLVGVGYEVVLEEPQRAVGLLQRIGEDEASGVEVEASTEDGN